MVEFPRFIIVDDSFDRDEDEFDKRDPLWSLTAFRRNIHIYTLEYGDRYTKFMTLENAYSDEAELIVKILNEHYSKAAEEWYDTPYLNGKKETDNEDA
jgi:hypoxanthine phosphoribosyltransferase